MDKKDVKLSEIFDNLMKFHAKLENATETNFLQNNKVYCTGSHCIDFWAIIGGIGFNVCSNKY